MGKFLNVFLGGGGILIYSVLEGGGGTNVDLFYVFVVSLGAHSVIGPCHHGQAG